MRLPGNVTRALKALAACMVAGLGFFLIRYLQSPQIFVGSHGVAVTEATLPKHTEARPDNIELGEQTLPEENTLNDVRLKYSLLRRSYLDEDSKFSPADQLNGTYVPANVHYMWCGRQMLEFKQYLSIMSVIREVRPDRVVFHYQEYPPIDKVYYNQWLDDLKYEYPFLVLSAMDDHDAKFCSSDREQKIMMIMETLNKEGGIYFSENTWMLNFDPHRKTVDLEFSLEPETLDGYIILRRGTYNQNRTYEDMLGDSSYKTRGTQCAQVRHVYNGDQMSSCLNVRGKQYDVNFYPMDIWELDNEFGRIARRIFYGTSDIRRPEPSYDSLVPNIGHMVWLGGGKMDFVFYLSALSVLYVVNVDMLYIHGDKEPAGDYWPELKKNPRVKYILRPPPTMVYQGEIPYWYKSLMSDIIRCDLMIKYGGIYTDTDAIWVKPLTQEERGYDAVASFDWIDWSYPFPDSVNMGISYGKSTAPFWQIFRESMRVLHNKSPGYTGVQMPYKLLEKYPHLLRIDRRLSVICYKFKCHPTWVKNYHDINNNHVTSNSIPNWREDVHAFHWTHPNPPEYANMSALLSAKGVFAELGKNVLEKAGLLPGQQLNQTKA